MDVVRTLRAGHDVFVLFMVAIGIAVPARELAAAGSWKAGSGLYSDPTRWFGGVIPGPGDEAYFTPAGSYTVTFTDNRTNRQAEVGYGNATFDLDGHTYTLATASDYPLRPSLRVGSSGSLAVTNSSTVVGTLSTTYTSIGFGTGDVGAVTVDGASTRWTGSSDLFVGQYGAGTLNVTGGAGVSASEALVGLAAGATGTAVVSGAGSALSTRYRFFVGYAGAGSLTVGQGATARADLAFIGSSAGSTGAVTVAGPGSAFDTTLTLHVGYEGTGTLSVSGGGRVVSGSGELATFPGSSASATVEGSGTVWQPTYTLIVGYNGTASLAVATGGVVTGRDAYLGYGIGGGTVTVVDGDGPTDGLSTWAVTGELYLGGHEHGPVGGRGTLDVRGGLVTVAGPLRAWGDHPGTAIHVSDGGAIVIGSPATPSALDSSAPITIGAGSSLTLHGTLTLTGAGGRIDLAPGGALTVDDGAATAAASAEPSDVAQATSAGSTADVIRSYIRDGRLWSSAAPANHAIGYARSADGTLSLNLTLVGDANLDGLLDADDYVLIDRGFALGLTDWQDGDFDHSGTVTPADYLLIDQAYAREQGGVLTPDLLDWRGAQFGGDYVKALTASVPEPATPVAVAGVLLPLAGGRRCCRRRCRHA